jgi:predicted phage tail protein
VVGTTSYTDANVTVGTPYFYKVRANNSYGESALSNEANATATAITAPGAPQNLVATPGKGKVTLTWSAPSDDGGSAITGYQILRATDGGSASIITTVSATTLTYVDEDGTAGTNYTYTVKAVNAIGAGSASTPVTTTPQEDTGGGGSDNTMLYIGAAVVGVAAIGGIAYFLMRKKK